MKGVQNVKERDLKLSEYNISREKYRELKYFCLQYPEWKHQLQTLTDDVKAPIITDMPTAHNGTDSTATLVLRRIELAEKCALIEQTAQEVCGNTYLALLKNVTEGLPYENIIAYSGRRKFYEDRRKFFYKLSKKR